LAVKKKEEFAWDKEKIKDFIIAMLGAPIVKIELDDQLLELVVNRTTELMDGSAKVQKWSPAVKQMVAEDGALAQAKLILGRVRGKYKGPLGSGMIVMDGKELLNEGERQYFNWQEKVFGKGE